ncbi:NifB/NifX family molybdenum-iron cluster-binding protein [Mycoplasmatota bacterium]|nr:NifB/NifX family molybdenum-iron cluster-binding protein [Mycoplasmatota bacterium]
MIIVLPIKEESEKSIVSDQLGRANYFYVYHSENDEGVIFKNTFLNENHGAGVKTAEFLLKQNADVLITPRIGEKALEILLETKVKIFKSNAKIVKENIKDYLNGDLEELY